LVPILARGLEVVSTPRPNPSPRRLLTAAAALLLLIAAAACQAPADTTNGQTGAAPTSAGAWA
jgi:hypothetical protein